MLCGIKFTHPYVNLCEGYESWSSLNHPMGKYMYFFIERYCLFWKSNGWSWIFFILRIISLLVEMKRLKYKKGRTPACTNRLVDQISPSSGICKGLQLRNTKNAIRTQWWGSKLEWTKAEMQEKVSITILSLLLTLLTAALSLTWSLSGLEGLSKAVCLLILLQS